MNSLRKTIITIIGSVLLLFGIIFIALPGTILIVLLGLTILALEYSWARKNVKTAQSALSKGAKSLDKFIAKCRKK